MRTRPGTLAQDVLAEDFFRAFFAVAGSPDRELLGRDPRRLVEKRQRLPGVRENVDFQRLNADVLGLRAFPTRVLRRGGGRKVERGRRLVRENPVRGAGYSLGRRRRVRARLSGNFLPDSSPTQRREQTADVSGRTLRDQNRPGVDSASDDRRVAVERFGVEVHVGAQSDSRVESYDSRRRELSRRRRDVRRRANRRERPEREGNGKHRRHDHFVGQLPFRERGRRAQRAARRFVGDHAEPTGRRRGTAPGKNAATERGDYPVFAERSERLRRVEEVPRQVRRDLQREPGEPGVKSFAPQRLLPVAPNGDRTRLRRRRPANLRANATFRRPVRAGKVALFPSVRSGASCKTTPPGARKRKTAC